MQSLEAELDRIRDIPVAELADAIETIGFECTRCGGCCKAVTSPGCGDDDAETTAGAKRDDNGGGVDPGERGGVDDTSGTEPHTATVFPDEIRRLQAAAAETGEKPYDWRDVARPMPYGLDMGGDRPHGETFEWALQTNGCGDCTFYTETEDGTGVCSVHGDRPLICRTYPFSLSLGGAAEPMGAVVDREGAVRAHECEGLGREIDREEAEALAETLKERTIRERKEAIGVRDNYRPIDTEAVVVHDSEGQKRPDGTAHAENPTDRR